MPGVYVWAPPDKSLAVYLSLDVVERMLQDVMRGFGAVPKRGAEVGGVLLGRVTEGEKTIVSIDDYELVPIEYKRSPSYLLSQEDVQTFDSTVDRTRNNPDPRLRPVGYFRSHTREGTGLGPEDLAILDQHFKETSAVALVIKPYATKVSQAGFYFRENGSFQSGPPLLEFPFRRRDLDPDAAQGRRSRMPERAPSQGPPPSRPPETRREQSSFAAEAPRSSRIVSERMAELPLDNDPSAAEIAALTEPLAGDYPPEPPPVKKRSGWAWVPLSFIFLLLGVLLGVQATLSMRPQLPAGSSEPYKLNLTAAKSGDNLQIKWDRQALAIRNAQKGMLTITEGNSSKRVALNALDLQSGTVVYPPFSDRVSFRLDVYLNNGREVLSENFDWHQ